MGGSGGSRGSSMGSMKSPFWRAAFEDTMRKRTTYTTLSLELRTSASTVVYYQLITHMCQLLYQEFDARAWPTCTFILPEARGNRRDNERSERANSSLFMHCSVCSGWRYAISMRTLMRITRCFAAFEARSGVTPLILRASNTTTRFSNRSSSFCNFTPRIHQKRSQKVRNQKKSWWTCPQTPLAGTLRVLKSHNKNALFKILDLPLTLLCVR